MKSGAITFLAGVFVGYEGVKIATHVFYLSVIAGLVITHVWMSK